VSLPIASGHPPVDRYLADGFERVRGMSSRFSAAICARVLRRQSEAGVTGPVAEIGAFEGRFLIAMALALEPGECAYGFDTFDWPDHKVEERFIANCRANGVPPERVAGVKRDSRNIAPIELRNATDGKPVRFLHLDGDHRPETLASDLALAQSVLHRQGVIAVDDMLHPEYPFLVVAVYEHLKAHPDMRLLCVIDREDIVASAKFLLCRVDAVPLYEEDLMTRFAEAHYTLGGDALGHLCVVLTPQPRIFALE
jgi:Methyltransferase domain